MPTTMTQMKQQLDALTAQIRDASSALATAAMDTSISMDTLTQQQEALTGLQGREAALRAAYAMQQEEMDGFAGTAYANDHDHGMANIAPGFGMFNSAGDFFRAVANADSDPRMPKVAKLKNAATGQNIGTDAEGGYLVPPDYAEGLLKVVETQSVLAQKVQRISIAGNRLIVNKLKDEDRTDGNRGGGILAYWTGEAGQYTASKAMFEQDQTDLHKLTGLCFATDEMLEDDVAMASFLSQSFAEEFAFKEDDAILWGTGNGMPQGILHTGNTALVTVPKESGQAAGTINLQNIIKMYTAMPAKNRASAEWYINQDVEMQLLQMLFATGGLEAADVSANLGVPVFLPAGGASASPYGHLFGRPLVPVEQCAALGSVGDISFMDLSQYRMAEKNGMKMDTSIHVRFDYGEQAFRFTLRIGGKPMWTRPLKPYKGSTERSPFVTLAARA